MTERTALDIKRELDHPVVDCDGHLLEVIPHVAEHVREASSGPITDRFIAKYGGGMTTLNARAVAWWGTPRHAIDRAAAYIPSLFYERLPELGIDYAVVYPTSALAAAREPDPELRHAEVRGFNAYFAEIARGHADRFTIPAVIAMDTPGEALGHLEHAIGELGLKTGMFASFVERRRADGSVDYDVYGLDSDYDYDPVWQRCVELGVAVTAHSGSQAIGFRSTSNYMYNHVGHFAEAGHAIAKALVFGGVTRRFPTLNFAFLEGGAAWAVIMLADIIARWNKRGGPNIFALDPNRLDVDEFNRLLDRHGEARYASDEVRRWITGLGDRHPEHIDEFWRMEAKSPDDIVELFAPRFYFGCEADDPTNAWAFSTETNGCTLNAVLGSDLSHWDVPDAREILPEAYELVERGFLTPAQFQDFACDNAIRLHGQMNPSFFAATAVETYAQAVLGGAT